MYYKWHKLPSKRRYEIVDGGNRSLLQFVGELSQISFPQEFLFNLEKSCSDGHGLADPQNKWKPTLPETSSMSLWCLTFCVTVLLQLVCRLAGGLETEFSRIWCHLSSFLLQVLAERIVQTGWEHFWHMSKTLSSQAGNRMFQKSKIIWAFSAAGLSWKHHFELDGSIFGEPFTLGYSLSNVYDKHINWHYTDYNHEQVRLRNQSGTRVEQVPLYKAAFDAQTWWMQCSSRPTLSFWMPLPINIICSAIQELHSRSKLSAKRLILCQSWHYTATSC